MIKNLLLLLALAIAGTANATQQQTSINLDITTTLGDTPVYYEGDQIQFLLSLERNAYITLFYLDAANNLIQIFPNANTQHDHYESDAFIPIPDAESGFSFRVEPPFGTDQVWAFASGRPIKLDGVPLKNGLLLINRNIEQVRNLIKSQAGELFDESSKKILTRPLIDQGNPE